ncbi:conserved hypothetical protein [Cellulomonas flavigena DSM 20109]|uniref:Uncharacterized protein n=1 Tax=Cellulomonas flavigena (strain ATCC 482 / DSM 20109 / BCRC 11376 / JCM 18109 / NBRC 3775 / NCIMB 8073 / NRS 134) TaxID=446466 RepID=D5UI06_CELFN|nr:hypothetical protein [Cellulomonas flavigena]ADG73430.1 conserved hypothetical protein [Cellulomonas flavigena DSM 20109]
MEDVLDDLYGGSLDDFVARRDAAVRAAKAAKDRDLAGRIGSLRKPTVAAWAVNLLVRDDLSLAGALRDLGEGMRDAERSLDGPALRELGKQRRALVSGLVARARRLASDAGQKLSTAAAQEVEHTLTAALADPKVADAVAAGTLTHGTEHVGFGSADAAEGGRGANGTSGGRSASRPPERTAQSVGTRGPADAGSGTSDAADGEGQGDAPAGGDPSTGRASAAGRTSAGNRAEDAERRERERQEREREKQQRRREQAAAAREAAEADLDRARTRHDDAATAEQQAATALEDAERASAEAYEAEEELVRALADVRRRLAEARAVLPRVDEALVAARSAARDRQKAARAAARELERTTNAAVRAREREERLAAET